MSSEPRVRAGRHDALDRDSRRRVSRNADRAHPHGRATGRSSAWARRNCSMNATALGRQRRAGRRPRDQRQRHDQLAAHPIGPRRRLPGGGAPVQRRAVEADVDAGDPPADRACPAGFEARPSRCSTPMRSAGTCRTIAAPRSSRTAARCSASLTTVALIPDRNIGFSIAINSEEGEIVLGLMYELLDHYLGLPAADWPEKYHAFKQSRLAQPPSWSAREQAKPAQGRAVAAARPLRRRLCRSRGTATIEVRRSGNAAWRSTSRIDAAHGRRARPPSI